MKPSLPECVSQFIIFSVWIRSASSYPSSIDSYKMSSRVNYPSRITLAPSYAKFISVPFITRLNLTMSSMVHFPFDLIQYDYFWLQFVSVDMVRLL